MTTFDHIMLAALAWMLLGNSLRFAAIGAHALAPVARHGCSTLVGVRDAKHKLGRAMDDIYIRLMGALTTTASGALVYAGMFFVGLGMIVRVSSSILRYTGDQSGMWHEWSQMQNLISSPMLVVGMSCIIAAVGPHRTASLVMSAAFVIAGIGIGYVTNSAVFR